MIGPEGEQMGIFQTRDAMRKAEDCGLDLVEISPTAKPPVCRIMDFGKYKYEQAKKQHAARKQQVTVQLKEVKMRPSTGEHDLGVKFTRIREFLAHGCKVKVTVQFRGRELAHRGRGRELIDRMVTEMTEYGVPEQSARFEGRFLSVTLAPERHRKEKKPSKEKSDAKIENSQRRQEAI